MFKNLTDDEMLAAFERHFLAVESEDDRELVIAGLRAVANAQIEKDARVIEYIRGSYNRNGNNHALLGRVKAAIRAQLPVTPSPV